MPRNTVVELEYLESLVAEARREFEEFVPPNSILQGSLGKLDRVSIRMRALKVAIEHATPPA